MVVIVENEEVTGALRRRMPPSDAADSVRSGGGQASVGGSVQERRRDLYAEYMRHDGRSRAGESDGLDLNPADEQFPDF